MAVPSKAHLPLPQSARAARGVNAAKSYPSRESPARLAADTDGRKKLSARFASTQAVTFFIMKLVVALCLCVGLADGCGEVCADPITISATSFPTIESGTDSARWRISGLPAHGRAHCRPQVHYRHVPVRRIRKVRLLLFMERMQMLRRLYVVRVLQTKKNAQGPLWEARKVYIY